MSCDQAPTTNGNEIKKVVEQNDNKKELDNNENNDDIFRNDSFHKNAEINQQSPQSTTTTTTAAATFNSFLENWAGFLGWIRSYIVRGLTFLSRLAALNPIRTIALITFISLSLLSIGLGTNFVIETEATKLFSPQNSKQAHHKRWILEESNFYSYPAFVNIVVHQNGANVLGMEGVTRLFDTLDILTSTKGYDELCVDHETGCTSTNMWESRSEFEKKVTTDEDAIKSLSSLQFANGEIVNRAFLFGTPQPPLPSIESGNFNFTNEEITLTSVRAYMLGLELPQNDQLARDYMERVIRKMLDLKEDWGGDPSTDFQVDFITRRSFGDELSRAIESDIPLMALAFFVMGAFCFLVLSKRNRIRSKGGLGIAAVLTIMMSLATSYGFFFLIGIPFTSLTQVFPFILVGIGLDDTFIITGYFHRTDPNKPLPDRISDTMQECGMSIFVTTLTTFLAFLFGSLNSITAVRWFCLYAGPTVAIDFLYQITYFIAFMALDERRIERGRYDVFCCIQSKSSLQPQQPQQSDDAEEKQEEEQEQVPSNNDIHYDPPLSSLVHYQKEQESFTSQFMGAYADFLLKPMTKVFVLLLFSALLCSGSYFASKMTQAFQFTDMTPSDSYIDKYLDATDVTATGESNLALIFTVYFRDEDFSDPDVQDAMTSYVDELVELKQISNPPVFFWLRDLKLVLEFFPEAKKLSFNDQVDLFLRTEPFKQVYSKDIVRNDSGDITACRTYIMMDQVSRYDVHDQMRALRDERKVTRNQDINNNNNKRNYWSFFVTGELYDLWEFYVIIVGELILSTVLSVIAVFFVSLLFIPHPLGCLIVTITVAMIYVELLGVLNIAGLHINSVTAIGQVMAIGLVVDYSMHIVFTYFEMDNRGAESNKVKDVLRSMGSSVLLGGLTTFLGVLPLAFSTSEVFWSFFVGFLGIVTLGVGHGLIFIPVVLSFVG